jgi:hypothetical protein
VTRIPVPESGVLSACLGLLAAERIWHERRNTVPIWVETKDRRRRPIKVAEEGTADIFATPMILVNVAGVNVKVHQPLWIETKSDVGRQSSDQKEFQRNVEASGHEYIMVRSPDVLKAWLIQHGAMRKK